MHNGGRAPSASYQSLQAPLRATLPQDHNPGTSRSSFDDHSVWHSSLEKAGHPPEAADTSALPTHSHHPFLPPSSPGKVGAAATSAKDPLDRVVLDAPLALCPDGTGQTPELPQAEDQASLAGLEAEIDAEMEAWWDKHDDLLGYYRPREGGLSLAQIHYEKERKVREAQKERQERWNKEVASYKRMIEEMPESERDYYPFNADMTYNTNYRRCVHYIRPDPETEDDEPDCSDAGDSDEGEGVQDAL